MFADKLTHARQIDNIIDIPFLYVLPAAIAWYNAHTIPPPKSNTPILQQSNAFHGALIGTGVR